MGSLSFDVWTLTHFWMLNPQFSSGIPLNAGLKRSPRIRSCSVTPVEHYVTSGTWDYPWHWTKVIQGPCIKSVHTSLLLSLKSCANLCLLNSPFPLFSSPPFYLILICSSLLFTFIPIPLLPIPLSRLLPLSKSCLFKDTYTVCLSWW